MRVIIVGAGGHGAVVADVLMCMGRAGEPVELAAFVDDHPPAGLRQMCGVRVLPGGLGALQTIAHDAVIVAIGNNAIRRRMTDELRRKGVVLASARHPSSVVAADAIVGGGTVICAGAVVNPAARIGRGAIINTHSSIDHHNDIGDGAHIGPGAHLGGNVTVGKETLIGIGSTVLPQTRIGARVIVGAGSVVIRDLQDDVVALGVPARVRRQITAPRRTTVGRAPTAIGLQAAAHEWKRKA